MGHFTGNIDDFGIDTASLSGTLENKLAVLRRAGFSKIAISAEELTTYPEGLDAAIRLVQASGLRVSYLKGLSNYEGLTGAARDFKIEIAKSLLKMCHRLQCCKLLVSASTVQGIPSDLAVLAKDLRCLALLAIPMQVNIIYRAKNYLQAWDLVNEVDMPNLGLGLDVSTVTMISSAESLEDMELVDIDKLFMVQLADSLGNDHPILGQVFPGAGCQRASIAMMVKKLHQLGYHGDYCFEVTNPDFAKLTLETVVQFGMEAAIWLGEGVLNRSVPLSNQIRLRPMVL